MIIIEDYRINASIKISHKHRCIADRISAKEKYFRQQRKFGYTISLPKIHPLLCEIYLKLDCKHTDYTLYLHTMPIQIEWLRLICMLIVSKCRILIV